jgi:hypothetical protein
VEEVDRLKTLQNWRELVWRQVSTSSKYGCALELLPVILVSHRQCAGRTQFLLAEQLFERDQSQSGPTMLEQFRQPHSQVQRSGTAWSLKVARSAYRGKAVRRRQRRCRRAD